MKRERFQGYQGRKHQTRWGERHNPNLAASVRLNSAIVASNASDIEANEIVKGFPTLAGFIYRGNPPITYRQLGDHKRLHDQLVVTPPEAIGADSPTTLESLHKTDTFERKIGGTSLLDIEAMGYPLRPLPSIN